jgi:hypothetical protein
MTIYSYWNSENKNDGLIFKSNSIAFCNENLNGENAFTISITFYEIQLNYINSTNNKCSNGGSICGMSECFISHFEYSNFINLTDGSNSIFSMCDVIFDELKQSSNVFVKYVNLIGCVTDLFPLFLLETSLASISYNQYITFSQVYVINCVASIFLGDLETHYSYLDYDHVHYYNSSFDIITYAFFRSHNSHSDQPIFTFQTYPIYFNKLLECYI